MSRSPQILKAGLVLMDPETEAIVAVVSLQYNPDSVTRTLQPQAISEGGDRAEALRLTGPPVETVRFAAEIDATDQLAAPRQHPDVVENGIAAQLAALETIVYPDSDTIQANHRAARSGTLEIAPMEAPLSLLVWSKNRVVPVRITSFSITEQAFDRNLNPIRASVDLELRVLNVTDLGFDHKGGSLYLAYQQQKENQARRGRGRRSDLGLTEVP